MSTAALAFTIGDPDTAVAKLTVKAASSNTSLVPAANLALAGSGTNRTIKVKAASGKSGTAKITLTVSDGAKSATSSFTVTVALNKAPTITAIANQVVSPGVATAALPFQVADTFTPAAQITVSAASSNTALVPAASITLGGSGASRTIKVKPVTGKSGSAKITLTASDGVLKSTRSFTVTANTAPTISALASRTIAKNGTTGSLSFKIADRETTATRLKITKASSNLALVPLANIVIGGSGGTRTVKVTPAAGKTGSARITITVSDGVRASSTSFTVNVAGPITAAAPSASNASASSDADAIVARVGDVVTLGLPDGTTLTGCQWWKDGGLVSGAIAPQLTLTSVTLADAGDYRLTGFDQTGVEITVGTEVTVIDCNGAARPADDRVDALDVTSTLAIAGRGGDVSLSILLPPGWRLVSVSGGEPAKQPRLGDTDLLEWSWSGTPSATQVLRFRVETPAGTNTPATLEGVIQITRPDGAALLPVAIPVAGR
jgi:hypothetical protein